MASIVVKSFVSVNPVSFDVAGAMTFSIDDTLTNGSQYYREDVQLLSAYMKFTDDTL
jgi:hypothetical protein